METKKSFKFITSKGNEVDLLEMAQLIDVSPEEHKEIADEQMRLVKEISETPGGTWLETEEGRKCMRLHSQAYRHLYYAHQKRKK